MYVVYLMQFFSFIIFDIRSEMSRVNQRAIQTEEWSDRERDREGERAHMLGDLRVVPYQYRYEKNRIGT